MKFLNTSFLLLVLIFTNGSILSQQMTPPVSSHVQLRQSVGFTKVTLDYSRPNKNGREIFGHLIPFGKVWRAGANECSKISFSEPIEIDNQLIAKGIYSIFLIPNQESWTFILNADTTLWGSKGYQEAKDIHRFSVKPKKSLLNETMSWSFENIGYAHADLVFKWDTYSVEIPIQFQTNQQTLARIKAKLDADPSAGDYYNAARYLLETDGDLETALNYIQKRVDLGGNQFGILRYKAIIEQKLGKLDEAKNTMILSRDLAKEAGNDHYVRMNVQTLEEWKITKSSISGHDLLQQSIGYHDPKGLWKTDKISISLFETRPGGNPRYSHLTMSEGEEMFKMEQWREKDFIERDLKGDQCTVRLNGQEEIDPDKMKQLRLTCEGSQFYKNYYMYLWGLPMKLKDEGTIIQEQVLIKNFEGVELLEMKVTYQKNVGEDIWYFYFHPQTKALSGYRFYHDESINDGEFITLEGEAIINGIRFPKKRNWFMHQGRKYLGSDEIIKE